MQEGMNSKKESIKGNTYQANITHKACFRTSQKCKKNVTFDLYKISLMNLVFEKFL